MNRVFLGLGILVMSATLGCSDTSAPPSEETVKEVQAPVEDMMSKMKSMKAPPPPGKTPEIPTK